MMYEVGQSVEVSEWSYNAPVQSRGERGTIIDMSGSVGDSENCYTVDLPEFGPLQLVEDDIKPLAPESTEEYE